MKRIAVTSPGSLIASRNKRYLGSGAGGISPSYPKWSFLSGSNANRNAPGNPNFTAIPNNGVGDPRANASGFTNFTIGTLPTGAPTSVMVGGNSISLGQGNAAWIPFGIVAVIAVLGVWFLLKE